MKAVPACGPPHAMTHLSMETGRPDDYDAIYYRAEVEHKLNDLVYFVEGDESTKTFSRSIQWLRGDYLAA